MIIQILQWIRTSDTYSVEVVTADGNVEVVYTDLEGFQQLMDDELYHEVFEA